MNTKSQKGKGHTTTPPCGHSLLASGVADSQEAIRLTQRVCRSLRKEERAALQCLISLQSRPRKRKVSGPAGPGPVWALKSDFFLLISFPFLPPTTPPCYHPPLCGRRRGTATLRHAARDWQCKAAADFRLAASHEPLQRLATGSSASWRQPT